MSDFVPTIHKTKDYSKFAYLPQNREIKTKHVEKLVELIKIDNRLYLHPLSVFPKNKKLYILDGQHRFESAKLLHTDVYYIENSEPHKESLIHDQCQRKWIPEDYLHYWTFFEEPEYLKIQSYIKDNNFTLQQIYCIFVKQRFECSDLFKKGKFKFTVKMTEFFEKIINPFNKIKDLYKEKNKLLKTRDFMLALYWMFINHKDKFDYFLNVLQDKFFQLPDKASKETFELNFCRMYNSTKKKPELFHPLDTRKQKNKEKKTEELVIF